MSGKRISGNHGISHKRGTECKEGAFRYKGGSGCLDLAKPNYKRLGKVYGPKMKEAAREIESLLLKNRGAREG